MKLKAKPIIKWDGEDKYVFVNGVATVPGLRIGGQEITITLKEFNEFRRK